MQPLSESTARLFRFTGFSSLVLGLFLILRHNFSSPGPGQSWARSRWAYLCLSNFGMELRFTIIFLVSDQDVREEGDTPSLAENASCFRTNFVFGAPISCRRRRGWTTTFSRHTAFLIERGGTRL